MDNTKAATVGIKEKWADKIRMFSGSPAKALELGPEECGALPDPLGVKDLPKTEIEIAAVNEVTAALNVFLKIVCGLEPMAFSPDRVHIMEPAEFQAKISHGRFSGLARLGQVYLERNPSTSEFMALLAHEMFHAVSYLWLDLWEEHAVSADGLRWPPMTMRRAGLALIDPSYDSWLPHFHGLNEGVTETAAMVVRQIAAKQSRLLDEAGRQHLARFIVSMPLIAFTDKLIATALGSDDDRVAMSRALFLDCLRGSDDFLGSLETKLPGATEILRRTGARPEELLRAVELLGFADTAAYIRQYCK